MNKKIVVTGGAGYLGSIMTERFLAAGHRVTIVDNLMYGPAGLFQHCANPNFEFIFGDARDRDLMRETIKDADVIVPLAALVGAPVCKRDPLTAQSVNTDAVRMLLELRSEAQLVVYPNTNSGYGTQTGEVFCTEDTSLDPITLYGQTKVEAEKAVLDTAHTVVLRLGTVFGASPRMRIDLLVNHFHYPPVTDGYIGDL